MKYFSCKHRYYNITLLLLFYYSGFNHSVLILLRNIVDTVIGHSTIYSTNYLNYILLYPYFHMVNYSTCLMHFQDKVAVKMDAICEQDRISDFLKWHLPRGVLCP